MVGITTYGATAMADAFKALGESVSRREVLVDGLTEAAEPMRARMAELAPRSPDAPHIAESIAVSEVRSLEGVRLAETEAAVAIGPEKGFFYGWFIEFGWVHHPQARPFVRTAYEALKGSALEAIGRSLWRAIARAWSREGGGARGGASFRGV